MLTFANHLFRAIGAAIIGLPVAAIAVYLGGPIAGLAALGGLSVADQGDAAMLIEITRMAFLGAVLQWTRMLPLVARVPLISVLFGALELTRSVNTVFHVPLEASIMQALIGAGLALIYGSRWYSLREKRWGKSNVQLTREQEKYEIKEIKEPKFFRNAAILIIVLINFILFFYILSQL